MNTSFYERITWVQRIAMSAVLLVTAAWVWRMMVQGQTDIASYAWVYLIAFGVLVVAIVAGAITVSILSVVVGKEDPDTIDRSDERDKVIDWRADACTSWVVGIGVVAALILLAVEASPVWVANALVAASYLSAIAKNTLQLYWYRNGMRMPR